VGRPKRSQPTVLQEEDGTRRRVTIGDFGRCQRALVDRDALNDADDEDLLLLEFDDAIETAFNMGETLLDQRDADGDARNCRHMRIFPPVRHIGHTPNRLGKAFVRDIDREFAGRLDIAGRPMLQRATETNPRPRHGHDRHPTFRGDIGRAVPVPACHQNNLAE